MARQRDYRARYTSSPKHYSQNLTDPSFLGRTMAPSLTRCRPSNTRHASLPGPALAAPTALAGHGRPQPPPQLAGYARTPSTCGHLPW
jgi:hypothetical protein